MTFLFDFLLQEAAEKQILFEKLQREKFAAEKELEKVCQYFFPCKQWGLAKTLCTTHDTAWIC